MEAMAVKPVLLAVHPAATRPTAAMTVHLMDS